MNAVLILSIVSTLNSIVGIIYVSKEIYLSSTYTEPQNNWPYYETTQKPMNDSNTTDYYIPDYPILPPYDYDCK